MQDRFIPVIQRERPSADSLLSVTWSLGLPPDDSSSSRFVPKPIYSSFKIYKTKTALDIAPIRAMLQWNTPRVEDRKYLSLKRAGGFRLTFAGGENKSYDWENSALITLSVTELGDVVAFAANKETPEHKIFHDPNLGSEAAGKTRKELVLKRIGSGKPGYFFNFSVSEKEDAQQKRWSIAVSEGEFQVFLSLIQATLPNLLAIQSKAVIAGENEEAKSSGRSNSGSSSSSNVHEDSSPASSSSSGSSSGSQPRKRWGGSS
jgi:hypothetical protein